MNSAPATATDLPGWACSLLQANDSFFPTGGYAHSFGVESMIHEGVLRDRASLRDYVHLVTLPGLRHADLPLLAHVWQALAGPDWDAVAALSFRASAMKTAPELRRASENIGRQRAELCATLHPRSLAPEYLRRAIGGAWPFAATTSAALESRAVGAPVEAALAAYVYSSIAALLAAAMKLLRLGQTGAQTLLTEALVEAPRLVSGALATPLEDTGWSNPWLDIAAVRHETADARLFIS